jgi:heme exporter protein A
MRAILTHVRIGVSVAHSSEPSAPTRFLGRGLACRRGGRLVFQGLDFALGDGGALLLVGPNGSGKSSLLRVMAGLTPPAAGSLAWDGTSLVEDPAAHRARLHFIGHLDALKPVLTAAETLAFWASIRGGEPAAQAAALERFHLQPLADLPCRFLSAGQRRRLALARLLASPAPLWLLDEPTTGLDEESTADLLAAIAAHRSQGGMVVAATHLDLPLPGAARLALQDFAPRRAA